MAIFRPIPPKAKSQVNDEEIRELVKDLEFQIKNSQFNNAKATLRVLLSKLNGLKSYNVRLLNTITSVEEGLASEEISLTHAKKELREALDNYRDSVFKLLDSLVVPTQEEQLHAIDDLFKLSRETLFSFEKDRMKVKMALETRGLVLTTSPVVAITGPLLDVDKLKRNGFKAKTLEGYPVLLDQTVLGIRTDTVLDALSGEKKVSEGHKSRLPGTTPEQRKEIKQEVLETVLNRMKSQRPVVLGDENHLIGASWFWIVPSDHLKLWRSCTTSPNTVSSVSVKGWGFPFSAN